MLYEGHGAPMEDLGVPDRSGRAGGDPRKAWRLLAENFHLFRGTPSALWLNHVFSDVFGLDVALGAETADHYFDAIGEALTTEAFRPRALLDRFNIEVIATTESRSTPPGAPCGDPGQRLGRPGDHRLSPSTR